MHLKEDNSSSMSDKEISRRDFLFFYVNGEEVIERDAQPEWTLLWYLRNKLHLTGSKLGCGEGACGSCTVLVCRWWKNELECRTVNGCLFPLCSIDGFHLITIEGFQLLNTSSSSSVHPMQSRFVEMFASQCGFCTPGMLVALLGTVFDREQRGERATIEDIEESFDGNLCRCTGYRAILDAAKSFASDTNSSSSFDQLMKIFPEKLLDYAPPSLHIRGTRTDWFRPVTLKELLVLRDTYPGQSSSLLAGNTHLQLHNEQKSPHGCLICLTHIDELQECQRTEKSLLIGAALTLNQFERILIGWKKDQIDSDLIDVLLELIHRLGSTHIRNVASIGGNLLSRPLISDLIPILQVCDAQLHFANHPSGRRTISFNQFYSNEEQLDINQSEVLISIEIPLMKKRDERRRSFLRSYKQSERRQNCKALLSGILLVQFIPAEMNNDDDQRWIIESARLAFSGISSRSVLMNKTGEELQGKAWNRSTINQTCQSILDECSSLLLIHQQELKRTLIQSFLFKFYTFVGEKLRQGSVDSSVRQSVSRAEHTIPSRTTRQAVGHSHRHQSSLQHTTGEAIFTDDLPSPAQTLYGAFVLSTEANARIEHIDVSEASKVVGFVRFIDHRDVQGWNQTGYGAHDEEVFVSSICPCVGAIVGLIIAQNEQSAQDAANVVRVKYTLLSPRIFSISDAILHQSFLADEERLEQGNLQEGFAQSAFILDGKVKIGGQEHFYMETNAYLVIPSKDGGELTVYLGAQDPSAAQELLATALGKDASQIVCRVKRIGGGFGGKDSRSIFPCLALAVGAVKVGRPVRLNLTRQLDMSMTGHRHPFEMIYRIGFSNEGRFLALDLQMWNNGGHSLDQSMRVMKKAMVAIGNTYQLNNLLIRGRACQTHLPSNTAFRGFGGPQAMFVTETMVEHVAEHLGVDPLTIRRRNLFHQGDLTCFGQVIDDWNIPRLLDQLIQSSDFFARQGEIEVYNRDHPFRKRALSLVPNTFGIGFLVKYMNQAGALVHIYRDGSVLLTHGGVEMGQGLHTKMISVAAEVLRCDVNRIRISETSTDKVPNTSPTAASVSSDLNGMAVQAACEQLRHRLDRFIEETREDQLPWNELVDRAYLQRVDLSAHGFYATPEMIDADFTQNRAKFNYFTQGAAVSEVELDTLTGDWHLRRVDILMDVGMSLNPQIDIGQIEGAFMQGVGLFTMEQLIWGDEKQHPWIKPGELYSRGPDTYKIPSFGDVPRDMHIAFLADSSNSRAVFSSKGIGEPPLLLAVSVFFALKRACMAYRREQGFNDYFTLHSPATTERLRMACADEFTRRACAPNEHQLFQPKGSY